jgi:hypothetical protein
MFDRQNRVDMQRCIKAIVDSTSSLDILSDWGRLLRSDPVLAKLDAVMQPSVTLTRSTRTTLHADIRAHNCH